MTLTKNEILNKLAENATMKVLGSDQSQGSAALIKLSNGEYAVATAFHVIDDPAVTQYQFTNNQDISFQLNNTDFKRIGATDLAVCSINISTEISAFEIEVTNSTRAGDQIWVCGYAGINYADLLRITNGTVIGVSRRHERNGYEMLYSNPTARGMSGGAILNSEGRLIGIHAAGELDEHYRESGTTYSYTGANIGIPSYYLVDTTYNLVKTSQNSQDDEIQAEIDAKSKDNTDSTVTNGNEYIEDDTALYSKAFASYVSSNHTEALTELEKLLAIEPVSIKALTLKAKIKFEQLEYFHAMKTLGKLELLDPNNDYVMHMIGISLSAGGDNNGALEYFLKAAELNQSSAMHNFNCGNTLLTLGEHENAVAFLDAAIRLESMTDFYYTARGNCHHYRAAFSKAIEDYNKALNLSSDNRTIAINLYCRGNSHRELGRYNEALNDFSEAIFNDETKYEAYCNRGNLLLEHFSKPSNALEDAENALKYSPLSDASKIYVLKANAYSDLNEHRQAIDSYEIAIKLNPDSHAALWGKSRIKVIMNIRDEETKRDIIAAANLGNRQAKEYVASPGGKWIYG